MHSTYSNKRDHQNMFRGREAGTQTMQSYMEFVVAASRCLLHVIYDEIYSSVYRAGSDDDELLVK